MAKKKKRELLVKYSVWGGENAGEGKVQSNWGGNTSRGPGGWWNECGMGGYGVGKKFVTD